MAGVEFEEDTRRYGTSASPGMVRSGGYSAPQASNEPKMVRWLMGRGMSATASHAILIGVVIINFVIVFIVWKIFL